MKKTVRNTPADPTVKSAKIALGGQEYSLCWDFNAFAQAEALTGQNVLQALDFDGISAAQLRAVFYASLLKHQPEITPAKAGNLLSDPRVVSEVVQVLAAAYYAAQPEKTEDEPKNGQAPEKK